MFLATAVSKVEEKIGIEVSEDGTWMLTVGSDDEGIKIFSKTNDDVRVNEGRCRGVLKNWASSAVDCSKGCWTEIAGIEIGGEVK